MKFPLPAKNKGFTLLETLVAISILIVAITAPLAIIAQALRSSYYARDQVTAYYLAQEAVEFLRNKRDNTGLQGGIESSEWLDSFEAYGGPTSPVLNQIVNEPNALSPLKAYLVRDDIDGYRLVSCDASCPAVTYDEDDEYDEYDEDGSDGALYGEWADAPSIFTREIIISKAIAGSIPGNDDASEGGANIDPGLRELTITVKVTWRMANGTESDGVTIREHLTNWQLEKATP